MKKLVILGSTGSIGQQTLDIVRAFPQEFQVIGLAAGYNVELLSSQIEEFKPRFASCADPIMYSRLPTQIPSIPMEEMVYQDDVDLVMAATIGKVGLLPILRALEAHKAVALANKEAIVMAGDLMTKTSRLYETPILPVDSEPSAIWQCLQGEDSEISRLIITASGGPFRNRPLDQLKNITPDEALKHPTWEMGKKITIDSSTLMNKAFEVIEGHWLFNVPWDQIEVLIHPQSTIHSMVEFTDGSVKAQLGPPDMRLPIQYALFHPNRVCNNTLPRFDTSTQTSLTFQPLDDARYPCFELALETARRGGTFPAVLCAADEIAVDLFLKEHIRFLDIYKIIEKVIQDHTSTSDGTIENILLADEWARCRAREVAKG